MDGRTFYHGTAAFGLTVLRPFKAPFSNLDYPCVYLSSNEAMAAIYIWNKPFKWMSFSVDEDGVPVITESFPGHLKALYGGVSGCIYACRGAFITDEGVGIKHAAISKEPVDVTACDYVPDAYERLLRYEGEGRLRVRRFGTLTPQDIEGRDRTILRTIAHFNMLHEEHPLKPFIIERFPEVWARAERR